MPTCANSSAANGSGHQQIGNGRRGLSVLESRASSSSVVDTRGPIVCSRWNRWSQRAIRPCQYKSCKMVSRQTSNVLKPWSVSALMGILIAIHASHRAPAITTYFVFHNHIYISTPHDGRPAKRSSPMDRRATTRAMFLG